MVENSFNKVYQERGEELQEIGNELLNDLSTFGSIDEEVWTSPDGREGTRYTGVTEIGGHRFELEIQLKDLEGNVQESEMFYRRIRLYYGDNQYVEICFDQFGQFEEFTNCTDFYEHTLVVTSKPGTNIKKAKQKFKFKSSELGDFIVENECDIESTEMSKDIESTDKSEDIVFIPLNTGVFPVLSIKEIEGIFTDSDKRDSFLKRTFHESIFTGATAENNTYGFTIRKNFNVCFFRGYEFENDLPVIYAIYKQRGDEVNKHKILRMVLELKNYEVGYSAYSVNYVPVTGYTELDTSKLTSMLAFLRNGFCINISNKIWD